MAKVVGMNIREGRWHLRIVIPQSLRAAYSKDRINPSLGTSDRKEAIYRATIERAKWMAEFEAKSRELNPQAVEAITPDLAQTFAEGVRAMVLAGNDSLRQDYSLLGELARITRRRPAIKSLKIPGPVPTTPRDALAGMTTEESDALAWLNSSMSDRAGTDYAINNLRAAVPWIQHIAQRLGLSVNEKTPGFDGALRLCLAALREAREDASKRDSGVVVQTPLLPESITHDAVKPKRDTEKSLRDVYDRWINSGSKPRSYDSKTAADRALRRFESQHPGTMLTEITPDLGDRYRGWLLNEAGVTPKTARDQLNALKSLLKYAFEVLEWIPRQPWRSLSITGTATTKRRPWKDDELQRLFLTPLHTRYELPSAKRAGLDAAYWIPLLGLYTGARLGELCQLRIADVQKMEDIHVLVLTDEGEGQTIKTEAGRRSVPLHSELIRLGFLKYVQQLKDSGQTSLWPKMPIREGKPSDYFGRWFREHRHAVGLADPYPDFHCFRHSVRPQMRRAGNSLLLKSGSPRQQQCKKEWDSFRVERGLCSHGAMCVGRKKPF